jgi:hypothetical protein
VAVETLYGNGTVSNSGWTNATNAYNAPDGVNATASTVGSILNLTLADLSGTYDLEATSLIFYIRSMATNAGSRPQTQLVALLNASNTVLASFTTPTLSTTTLTTYSATFSGLTYTRAQIADLRIRVTTQEGGGMPGTIQHRLDAVWAEVTFTPFALLNQDAYRWRNDDGSETTATWKQLVNTPNEFALGSGNPQARLRFLIQEIIGAPVTVNPQLEYGENIPYSLPNLDLQQVFEFGNKINRIKKYDNYIYAMYANSVTPFSSFKKFVFNISEDITSISLVESLDIADVINSFQFSPDGLNCYLLTSSILSQHSLTTPWMLSTINLTAVSTFTVPSNGGYDFYITPNGSSVFFSDYAGV